MTDAELFGGLPESAPNAPQGDAAIWTVLGEAGGDPDGQKAVASVIANRAHRLGIAPDAVVDDPGQGFEAWTPEKRAALQRQYPVGSPGYDAAATAVGGILEGRQPAPYEYDTFYSPAAQKALGRQPPSWEDGSGQDIGGNRFFTGKFTAPQILSDADRAEWEKLNGDRGVTIAATPETPHPGVPSGTQGDAARFLDLHGFSLPDAPAGSSQNPVYETDRSGAPTAGGTWYVTRDGALRQVGSDVPDYLPAYRALASRQAAEQARPIPVRGAIGFGQGVSDVGGSVNRLLGGALGASPEGQFAGDDLTSAFDAAATQGYEAARNRYNLLHGPDTAATVGRVAGNLAATAPLMGVMDAPLSAAGAGVRSLAPAAEPLVDFLGGSAGRGNLLIHAPSRAIRGAIEGAEATALNSGQSDSPLGNQLLHGSEVGGALGAAIPVAGAAANRLFAGAHIAPEVAELADLATTKYGIPLRRSQILGTGDRNALIHDSEMIAQPGTGYAENQAAQRQAFTRAVAGSFGEDADKLTPDVMRRATARIGYEFERVARDTTISGNGPLATLQTAIADVLSEASQVLPDSDLKPIQNLAANIGSAIKDGALSGDSYLALTRRGSALDVASHSSNSNIRAYAQQLRDKLDDALEAATTPENLAALRKARFQYKNLMTVKNLAAKAGVTGDISPTLLNGAVNRSFRDRAFRGAGDLGELSQIGQTFMKEPPNSGTAPRLMDALKRNALFGGVAGGEGLALYLHDPALALKVGGAAAGAAALNYGRNMAAGAVNRSPVMVNRLIRSGQRDGVFSATPVTDLIADYVGPAYVPTGVLAERNRLLALPGLPAQ